MGHDVPPLANDQLRQLVEKERSRRAAEKSLYEFVRQGWHVLEPGVEFIESWHLRIIAEHLEAISKGEIKRLLINEPPRHLKSVSIVMWTVWEWIAKPHAKFLCSSYSGTLSIRDNLKARRLIDSNWFQERWGDKFVLTGDQNQKGRFENDQTGYRIATSVGGSVMGEGGDVLVCLHPDTLIECEDGPHRIHDLVEEQRPVRVLGYDHTTGKLGWRRIEWYERGPGRRSVRLTTAGGASIVCTEDHPVWIVGHGYVQARDVQNGQRALRYLSDARVAETEGVEKVKGDDLWQGVSQQAEESARFEIGVSGVRHDREASRVPSREEHDTGRVLQPQVSRSGADGLGESDVGWRHGGDPVRNLWSGGDSEERQIDSESCLFVRVSRGASATRSFSAARDETLCNLRNADDRSTVAHRTEEDLLAVMSRQVPQHDSDGRRERALRRRDEQRTIHEGVSSSHRACERSRQPAVSMVWDTGDPTWDITSRTSHRLRQGSQRHGEPDFTLSLLPWDDARQSGVSGELVEDPIVSVEPSSTPEFVYNVAVEGAHNYFANGLLLHNCDDPHGIADANSDVQRATTLEWFDTGWSTRLNNPRKGAMVVIMQRLHEGDVSGHILNDLGGWEHLCIPAEYDGVRRRTSRGEYDPRKIVGELICPERFGPQEIATLKIALGKAGTAGQLQQTPTPGDGGVLDVRQFRLWPAAAPMPQIRFVIQSYDGAYTEDTLNDPTACTVWGVFGHDKVNHIMLLDAWDEHLAYPELRKRVMQDWKAEYGGTQKGGTLTTAVKVSRVLVEDKSSGISLLQDLRRARVPVAAYNPGNASKVQRAHLASPVLDAGLIWIPESSSAPGKPVSWAEKMIDQLKKFPLADHDDLVDSTTAAIIYLKNEGFIELPTVEADPHDDVPTKRLVNPYAA